MRGEIAVVKPGSTATRATIYVVQPFEERKRGRTVGLAAAAPLPARDRQHAMLLLERARHRSGIVGAVAFSREGDPEAGEYDEAVILGKVGQVPEDLV